MFVLSAITIVLTSCGTAGAATTTSSTATTDATTTTAQASTTTTTTTAASASSGISNVQSPAISGPVVLRGNGIGNAVFGQPEATSIANLSKVLGPPNNATPTPSNNCTVDNFLQFPGIVIYFDHGVFVGYATGSANGENNEVLNVVTSRGLKIGDTLTEARQLYGAEFTTSVTQGGSWFAKTATGALAGYLTAEVNLSSATPRIADITVGSVGCPAASP